MSKIKQLAWVMGCVSAVSTMGGCALHQSGNKHALNIKPVMAVKHAASGSEAASMYWLGRYYQGKVDYTEAIAAYEKALVADPAHVEAHNGLGVSHSLQGRHELALQHLRKAVELSPLATHLRNNLGYAHLARGQESEAAAAFEQALWLDPENRQARSNLAAIYERVGLHDKAAMLTMTRAEPPTTPVAMSAPALGPTPGSRSATLPATVAAAAAGKQAVQHSARLVQVTSNVFELRISEVDPNPMMATPIGKTTGKTVPQDSANRDSNNVRIEVANANGVSGMARQVSGFLQRRGFAKARLTDRQPFQQAQTEIHYRPGNSVLAGQINQMMPKQVTMVESYDLRRDIQVRVLLGKDVAPEAAYFDNRGKIQIARSIGKATAWEQVPGLDGQSPHISTK